MKGAGYIVVGVLATLCVLAPIAMAGGAESGSGLKSGGAAVAGADITPATVTATTGNFTTLNALYVDAGTVLSANGFQSADGANNFLVTNQSKTAGVRLSSTGSGLEFIASNGSSQWGISSASGDLTSGQARNIITAGRGEFKGAGGGLRVGPPGSNVLDIAAGGSVVTWAAHVTYSNTSSMIFTPFAQTVADDGAGTAAAFNIDIGGSGGSQLTITCNDANGCNTTLLETSVTNGQVFCATNISANAVNFADTAGVSETAGAFAAGQYDSICFQYVTDRWVERSRSNN